MILYGKYNNKNINKEKFKFKNLFRGKNLAIVILSFLLFCVILVIPSDNTTELKNSIEELNNHITKQEQQIKSDEEKLKTLQNSNDELNQQIKDLNKEKEELKKENDSLRASNNQTTSNTSSSNSTTISNNISDNNTTQQMVWVGNTGNKYHRQSCRTLKGNGHQITYQQAISQGRGACQICKP